MSPPNPSHAPSVTVPTGPGVTFAPGGRPTFGPGWSEIFDRFVRQASAETAGGRHGTVTILEAEEKYGTLRIEYEAERLGKRRRRRLDAAVSLAEERSAATCAACGRPGHLRATGDMLAASCDGHAPTTSTLAEDGAGAFTRSRPQGKGTLVEDVTYDRRSDRIVVIRRRLVPPEG